MSKLIRHRHVRSSLKKPPRPPQPGKQRNRPTTIPFDLPPKRDAATNSEKTKPRDELRDGVWSELSNLAMLGWHIASTLADKSHGEHAMVWLCACPSVEPKAPPPDA